MRNLNKFLFLSASVLTLAACGSDSEEQATKTAAETALVESLEPEAITAADFVKDHKRENIDTIIADFNELTDENVKAQLNEQVADSDTSLFGKAVEVTGTAVEFVEGADAMSKGSFIVMTDGGSRVRVAAKSPNEALDIGEKVEVKGLLAMPLLSEDMLVREASVYIQ